MESENLTKLLYLYNAFAFINYVFDRAKIYRQKNRDPPSD